MTDQGTFCHQCSANSARDGSLYRGVVQIQACRFHIGLSRLTQGLGAIQRGLGGIEILTAHRILRDQRLISAHHGLGIQQRCIGPSQLALRTRQCRTQRGRVDVEQHIAGLHVSPFLEVATQHNAGHSGAHFRHAYRLDTPGQFIRKR